MGKFIYIIYIYFNEAFPKFARSIDQHLQHVDREKLLQHDQIVHCTAAYYLKGRFTVN